MILTQNDILRRILETKAVSIWNHKTGPIFWYAASVPGPFYVNTELVLGKELSTRLLKGITDLIAEKGTPKTSAEKLEHLIMEAYQNDDFFQSIIETMENYVKNAFPEGSFSLFSGGERRDWLFSIPLAKKMGIKHAYLFKNGDLYCEQPLKQGEIAIHVADLINNAASYFDAWIPCLEKNGLSCCGALAVNTRGSNGVDRLIANGQKVVALNSVNIDFFASCSKNGLIDEALVEELRLFFQSPQEWASAYVMDKPELFNTSNIDPKSFERLCSFFSNDPWTLRDKHSAFFQEMEKAIQLRRAA